MAVVDNEHPSWKREPLVWMLIGIPASAIIMGVVIITLSIQSWSGLVVDDYYKKGKQINRVLARDRFAHELGLAANFAIDETGRVEIRFDEDVSVIPGERIELKLVHSTRPGLDQTLNFDNRQLRRLEGEIALQGSGRWNLYLQTADWRLTGSMQFPDNRSADLLPNYIVPKPVTD